jgi:hypothetical protein
VEVAGEDGRRRRHLALTDSTRFDAHAFYAHAERHLPAYACPAFGPRLCRMDHQHLERRSIARGRGFDPARVPIRSSSGRRGANLRAAHAAVLEELRAARHL